MTDLDDPVNEHILRRIKRGDYKIGDFQLVSTFENYITAYIVKGLLEYVGIFTFLANENIALNKYDPNFLITGKISLYIHEIDLPLAQKALDADLDPTTSFYEDLKLLAQCPYCKSQDYEVSNLSYKIALACLLFFTVPIPFKKDKVKCSYCYREWKII